MAYERSHPDSPWLTQSMVEVLASWLRPKDQGLEWGSGRSTLWFACRVARLVSVEHDEGCYHKIRSELERRGLGNVEYHLCPDESTYVAVADQVRPESLDFVLVDGEARDRCALAGLSRLRPGGFLIVDNSNWYLPSASRAPNSRRAHDGAASETWHAFAARVEGWRCIWTSNGVWDTAVWVKPA